MKKAFTMLELVFVLVVIGILAAVIIPRTRTNPVQESAINLLSMVRYTQHLALVDDKYDKSTTWYKNRWQIRFNGNKYSIRDNDANLSNIDLNAKYGVTVAVSGTECGVAIGGEYIISFDHLGRPIAGDLSGAITPYSGPNLQLIHANDCNITLTSGTENATINIAPETGYTKVSYN